VGVFARRLVIDVRLCEHPDIRVDLRHPPQLTQGPPGLGRHLGQPLASL
jgi:hypothetical protein